MSFCDCTFDLREAERGEEYRRTRELAALGKGVSRELAALHAKLDLLGEMLGVPATARGARRRAAAPQEFSPEK